MIAAKDDMKTPVLRFESREFVMRKEQICTTNGEKETSKSLDGSAQKWYIIYKGIWRID